MRVSPWSFVTSLGSRSVPALVVALAGCHPAGPRPIAFGDEPCTHCHMTVADPRFTAEAVTTTGKIFVFDDIGCLTSWLQETGTPVRSAWVASFVSPGTWLPADSARYLTPPTMPTPMASGLIALRPGAESDSVQRALGGDVASWSEIRAQPHAHPQTR